MEVPDSKLLVVEITARMMKIMVTVYIKTLNTNVYPNEYIRLGKKYK